MQRCFARDRRHVARDLCHKKYVVGNWHAKQRSESDDVLVVYFLRRRIVALQEFTKVPPGLRACYFFGTLVRKDALSYNRAAEVSWTTARGGFAVSWWHPGWRVRIHYGTKTPKRSRRRQTKRGRILPLYPHALVMPPCGYRPIKCSLSGG